MEADAHKLSDVVTMLALDHGVSVMLEESLSDAKVTFRVHRQPVGRLLQLLGRLVDAELAQVSGIYYLGTLKPEDRAVLVQHVVRLSPDDIQSSVAALQSDVGRMSVTDDGLLIFADRVDVVSRVGDLLLRLRTIPIDTWVCQLHIVMLSNQDRRELGLDVQPSLDLSALLAVSSISDGPESLASAAAGLGVVLRAVRESSTSTVVAEPLLLVRDGRGASLTSGRVDPVPVRTVSPEGTVTLERFDFVETGFTLELELRQVQVDSAAIDLEITIDDVIGTVEGAPITSGFTTSLSAAVVSGGVYLLGELQRNETSHANTGILQLAETNDTGATTLQVWARCYRIAGPVVRQTPPSRSTAHGAAGAVLPHYGGVLSGALPEPPEAQNRSRSDSLSR